MEELADQPKSGAQRELIAIHCRSLIVPLNRHDIKRSSAPFILSEKLRDRLEGQVPGHSEDQMDPNGGTTYSHLRSFQHAYGILYTT